MRPARTSFIFVIVMSCSNQDDPPDFEPACLAECHATVDCGIRTNPAVCPSLCAPTSDRVCEDEEARLLDCKASKYECIEYGLPPCTPNDPCEDEREAWNACVAMDLPPPAPCGSGSESTTRTVPREQDP
jgi:hypothetical protein